MLLLRFANDLEEYAKVEQLPKLEGKKMFLYLAPKKVSVVKQSQQKRDRLAAEQAAKEKIKAEVAESASRNGLLDNAKGGESLKNLINEDQNPDREE